ncbi:MAG: dihydroorotate dehydrogenase [Gemmatimonadales bacterium]
MTGVAPRSGLTILGIRFDNPILLAAGTAGFGRELDGTMDLDRLGGIVTKAVSLEPRSGNPAPRVGEFPGGMINSVGLANPGADQVARHDLPWLADRLQRARVIVNVVGFVEDEYARVIERLDSSPAISAYEINLSCPNTSSGGIEFGADPEAVRAVLARAGTATERPLFAKLSPALADLPGLAAAAVEGGAAGISVVNTMPGMIYERDRPRLGQGNGGVSGPALLPVGLLATARVRRRLPDTPIIGLGGIRTLAHVDDYLRAGANLVAIGTAGLADPRLPVRLATAWERRGG